MSTNGRKRPLPAGWRWARLGEVARVFSGSAAPQERRFFLDGKYPFVRVSDLGLVGRSTRLTHIRDSVNDSAVKEVGLVLARAGTVIFPKSGAAITTNSRGILGIDAFLVSHLAGVTALEGITLPEWLYFWLCTLDMTAYSDNPGYPSLRISRVASIPIPVPPINEQRRVAARLLQQMAQVESMRQAARAQVEAGEALPAAFLRQVFESEEGKAWPKVGLGDVAHVVQNGIYKSAEYYGRGHPFVRMYNIDNASWNLNLDELAQVRLEGHELETYELRTGDLLISRVNSFELVGKTAWVGPDAEGHVFENMLIRVRLADSVDSLFMAQQMGAHTVRGQIEGLARRAIGQASINSQDLRSVQIALPPLGEQRRIAALLNKRMALVTKVAQTARVQLEAVNALPGALLEDVFGGFEPPP